MFKKYVYLFLVCYLFAQGVEAQITFDKEYPYVDSRQRSVISFSRDDGYIILASGNDYITIVKTDLAGDTLWVKYLDIGVPSTYDIGYIESACSDEEDNMYLKTYLTDYDLLKIDSVGNFIWGVNFPEYYPVWQVGPIYRNNFLWAVFKESPNKYYLYKINPVNGGAAWRTEICNSPGWALTSFTMNENGDAAASVVDSYEAPYFTEYNNRIYIKPADSSNFTYKTLYLCNDETYIEKLRYTGNELCGIARYPNASAPMDYSCYTRFTPSCNILLEEVISFDSDGSWVTTYNLNPDGDAVLNSQYIILIVFGILNC